MYGSLQCRRFLWARNLLAKAPCWNFSKRGGNGASLSPSHLPLPFLSAIFHCHKIKNGSYNNITNTNKVSLTQNTPALQAICMDDQKTSTDLKFQMVEISKGWNETYSYDFLGKTANVQRSDQLWTFYDNQAVWATRPRFFIISAIFIFSWPAIKFYPDLWQML